MRSLARIFVVLALSLSGPLASAQAPVAAPGPRASFPADYQAAHRGRIEVLVPEAYEMVNVAIALTADAAENAGRVATENDYYPKVMAHFGRWRSHPLVAALDARMRAEPLLAYIRLRLDAGAFEFDSRGRVVRSAIYDRISDDGQPNSLLPLLPELQSFADETGFREFYAANRAVYEGQAAFLRERTDIPGMWRWLAERFPSIRAYDAVKVVFSPLAGSVQNLVTFDADGFRELQAHVNFPYNRRPGFSDAGSDLWRGTLVFGEMNHAFLNPVSERHAAEIEAAIACRDPWTAESNRTAYPDDVALFDEYLNFGLIDLYHHDRMGEADRRAARARIQEVMVQGRGFPRFAEFDDFLLDRYLGRAPGAGIDGLYPALIDWFAARARDGCPE